MKSIVFRSGTAVGQYVRLGSEGRTAAFQIVGVIPDVRFRSPRQPHTRMAFASCAHVWKPPQTAYSMGLLVRTHGAGAEIEAAIRREVDAMGKQAVNQILPLDRLITRATRNERTLSWISTGFGLFVLLLTCAGVYALVDLTLRTRMRELGIRMALGANRADVLVQVLRGFAAVLASGAAAGLLMSHVISRAYQAYLYGSGGLEAGPIAIAVTIVGIVAVIAAIVPAWRAVRIDPASVLRLG